MTPRLRDGDRLRRGAPGDESDPDHWRRSFTGEGWDGFTVVDGQGELSGFDRPPSTVENEDEIMLEYRRQTGQPELRCGYCNGTHRARSVEGALRWWNAHDCDTLLAADSHALVTQLTPLAA